MSRRTCSTIAIIAIASTLSLTGCAQLNTETRVEESAFQAIHLIDAGQTLDIRHYAPRQVHFEYHGHEYFQTVWRDEGRGPFDAGWAIGSYPRDHQIYQYMTAEAGLHAGVTLALAHNGAPAWALRTWELVTIGIDAGTVAHNASIGLQARF